MVLCLFTISIHIFKWIFRHEMEHISVIDIFQTGLKILAVYSLKWVGRYIQGEIWQLLYVVWCIRCMWNESTFDFLIPNDLLYTITWEKFPFSPIYTCNSMYFVQKWPIYQSWEEIRAHPQTVEKFVSQIPLWILDNVEQP